MRIMLVALIAMLMSSAAHAGASDKVMEDFGLIGTWSPDCSREITEKCDLERGCPYRITFATHMLSAPSRSVQMGSINGVVTRTGPIDTAVRLSDDKLKLTYIVPGSPPKPGERVAKWAPLPSDDWMVVFVKAGSKIRLVESRSIDGRKLALRDGFIYQPKFGQDPDGIPSEWVNSGREQPNWEKCEPFAGFVRKGVATAAVSIDGESPVSGNGTVTVLC
jgi:hypothetical protein